MKKKPECLKGALIDKGGAICLFLLCGCLFRMPQEKAQGTAVPVSESTFQNTYKNKSNTHKNTPRKIFTAKAIGVTEDVPFTGIAGPKDFAQLHFALPGRIKECHLKAGDPVKEQQIVCALDDTAARTEWLRAKSAWQAAKRVAASDMAQKQRQLFEAGVIGQGEFEMTRVQSETSLAHTSDSALQKDLAEQRLREHALKSPFPGKILKVLVQVGQLVSPEIPVAIVASEWVQEVKTHLTSRYFNEALPGTTASVEDVGGRTLDPPEPLTLTKREENIDAETQTFSISLAPQRKTNWAPGIAVSGYVRVATKGYLRIPASFVSEERSGADGDPTEREGIVYVYENGATYRRKIKFKEHKEGWILVLNGLKENTVITQEDM